MPNLIKMSVPIVILFGRSSWKRGKNKRRYFRVKNFFEPLPVFSFIECCQVVCLARSKTHPSLGARLIKLPVTNRCQPWFIRSKKNEALEVNWNHLKDIGRIARLVALRCQTGMTIESYFFVYPNHTHVWSVALVSLTLKHTHSHCQVLDCTRNLRSLLHSFINPSILILLKSRLESRKKQKTNKKHRFKTCPSMDDTTG